MKWCGMKTCLIVHQGLSFTVHACHPAVPYMFTGLTGYSVDSKVSCDARKLARTPRIKKIIIIGMKLKIKEVLYNNTTS